MVFPVILICKYPCLESNESKDSETFYVSLLSTELEELFDLNA